MSHDISHKLKRLQKALKQQPRNVELHTVAASTYEHLGRHADALPHLEFLATHAGTPQESVYIRYVCSLHRTAALSKSLQVVTEGLRHYPTSHPLLTLKALTLTLMGDIPAACQLYAHLHTLNPADQEPIYMSGILKFLMTDMRDGYADYAQRPLDPKRLRLLHSLPRWSGEDVAGKSLFVWSEQGIGDAVMFLGLLPWIISHHARVTLLLTDKLAPVVQRSFPQATVLTAIGSATLSRPTFDYHIPVGDFLPHVLPHYTPAAYPPYLKPDSDKARSLRQSYLDHAARHGRTRLVGLSWHTTNPTVGFTRNITLDELRPILSIPGLQFVSLQYGKHEEEIAACNRRTPDILLTDAGIDTFNDIDGLAAQMAAMDHIITIDNATVHMAGALGVPTTVLLPTVPDWRWGLTASDCRWYSSVTLARQEALGKWHSVIKHIRSLLMDISGAAA